MSDLKTEESSIPLLSVADWDDTSSHSRPASPALGPHGSAGARTYLRQHIWAASGVAALLLLLPVGLFLLLQHTSDLELVPFRKGPPEFVCAAPSTTFKVADLLTSGAPALSLYDSLRPDLRYLFADSWSGMGGQFTSALALLYLAQLTQRVAILSSWRDGGHYGDNNIIRMSLLFDLDRLREELGLLIVEMDDIKPQDRHGEFTTRDDIGCYRASPWFDRAISLGDHNVEESTWDIPRPGGSLWWSFEAFVLFDYDSQSRLDQTREMAKGRAVELPRNFKEETAEAGLLCLTNVWDLQHAGSGVRPAAQNSHYGNPPFEPVGPIGMAQILTGPLSGVHPEWWHVGRFIDFTPAIWDIALSCVYETLQVHRIPPLITVHLRRGDFLGWCAKGQNCTPPIDDYLQKVSPLLLLSPPNTRVLVTTDEQTDLDFLASIDALGWYRIDHALLGTQAKLEAAFGEAWRWADSATDQAILSLGRHFVGTRGSQVSQLSELRVQTWNGGQSAIVDRPMR